MDLAPGRMVTPNVRLVQQLGAGGMGSVWIADHHSLRTQVAVKFVAEEQLEDDEQVLKRFNREAALAAQIKSPHVVQILDHGLTEDGIPFMVMELLEGEDLDAKIERDGPLSVQDTRVVLTQAAKALAKAHKLGIVHRDIKPANLFLVEPEFELFVKVFDFGIAKHTRMPTEVSLTTTGEMVGTPEFMSPEQVLSSKDVDHRADLWALGVVAYYALTGQVPFRGETLGSLCVAIANGTFRPVTQLRPDLPPAVDAWFLKALAGLPQDRFQDARTLALAFAESLGAGGAGTLVDEFSYTGDSRPSLDPSGDGWLASSGSVDSSSGAAAPGTVPAVAMAPTLLSTPPPTLVSNPSPTFTGATMGASPSRRVPRAALWVVLGVGLSVAVLAGVGYVQWGGADEAGTVDEESDPSSDGSELPSGAAASGAAAEATAAAVAPANDAGDESPEPSASTTASATTATTSQVRRAPPRRPRTTATPPRPTSASSPPPRPASTRKERPDRGF